MKQLSAAMAARLAATATTLATCFRLVRRDGIVMGFTDHDRPITLAGLVYEAASGLTTSETVADASLAVGGLEVSGALSSDAITEADIEAGLYDGARVEVHVVDWTDPDAASLHVSTGVIGEIVRADDGFRAEVRSLAAPLAEPTGRLYQHRCDADLGDARCGVALDAAAWRGTGTVTAATDRRRLVVTGLDGFADGWFDGGRLAFGSGANVGRAVEVKAHGHAADGTIVLDLWRPMAGAVAAGDGFVVTAGCDKRFETCRGRFANTVNFRGFPHIPGSDFLIASPAAPGQIVDGTALVS